MNAKTIRQLNSINQSFYTITAEYFSQSREYYWVGWNCLLPFLQKQAFLLHSCSVVDIGCGNGRFGQFLLEKMPAVRYSGLDSNPQLLKYAEEKLTPFEQSAQFAYCDIIESCLEKILTTKLNPYRPTVITLFGVLHHIPSLQLRKALIEQIVESLLTQGLLIFTTWDFQKSNHLFMHRVKADTLHIDEEQLEPNDYFLPWGKGVSAVRYCHLTTHEEVSQLIAHFPLHLVTQFTADGKNQENTYYVYQKT